MIPLLAWVAALVIAALALLHLYWCAGGKAGLAAALPQNGDQVVFHPSPLATLLVAVGLGFATWLLLTRAGIASAPWPVRWTRVGTWVLGALFALRTIGDFRYVGFFKSVRDTRFARADTRAYTPLCLALGAAVFAVAQS